MNEYDTNDQFGLPDSDDGFLDELDRVDAELASVEISLQELLEKQSELLRRKSELRAIIEQQESKHQQQKDATLWNSSDFPWSAQLDEKLQSVFGLDELRPMQRQTMNATMSDRDCLLLMPTGGGKSLCFQLPAVISKGLTLVVSPLVSLMEDQQMALELLNVPSAMLSAASSKEEQKRVLDDMAKPDGFLRLLYVTPERLAKSKRFMNKLEKCYSVGHLSRIVIDEVHCCSQWGHDFRPDYKFLGIMKRQFPKAPILGLTATATTKVLEDIKKLLNIPKSLVLKASFNRPNLFYEVREKKSTQKESIEDIISLIKGQFKKQSGIVYCFSRKEAEEVTTGLDHGGVSAGCYHADVDPRHRSQVHRRWIDGTLQVVVATIAFGMGIDKADVRFVIHHTISKSMENLYQESGRAGRDGNRSDCIVYYRLSDVIRQSTMVFTEQTGLSNLHGILKYCVDVASCRRSMIAHHFGELWDCTQCLEMCDHCHAKDMKDVEQRDITRHCADVLSILDAASGTEQRVTANKLIDAWYGKGPPGLRVKSVKPPSLSKYTAERILAHMLMYNYLSEDFHFTAYSTICYLVSGSKAKLIRSKMAKIMMDHTLPASSSSKSSSSQSLNKSSSLSSSTSNEYSEKPKLVIVNMEKSHFNSLSMPSTSSSVSSPKSSSASKHLSLDNDLERKTGNSNSSIKSGTVLRKRQPINISDDDSSGSSDGDLIFDEELMTSRPPPRLGKEKNGSSQKKNKTNNKLNSNSCINAGKTADSDSDDTTNKVTQESESLLTKKRKRIVISDDSDSEEDEKSDQKEYSSSSNALSRLSLKKKTKKGSNVNDGNRSISISDDELS